MVKQHLGYIYCSECQYRGKPDCYKSAGDIMLEIILFLLLVIPWVIYKLISSPRFQCPKCGNKNIKRLPGGETFKCPFCGARVHGFDPTCPQCGRKLSAGEKYQKTRIKYHKESKWKEKG